MKSLPKPTHLEIRLDEPRVARGSVDERSVRVKLKWRERQGYSSIVAALKGLPKATDLTLLKRADGGVELVLDAWKKMRLGAAKESFFEWARRTPGGLGPVRTVEQASKYAMRLIRQHRSDFDSFTPEEQTEFLLDTVKRVNEVARSLERLVNHLEYAEPGRKAVPPLKNPERDVRAAILKDVHGWSTLRIGEKLGVPPPASDANKGYNETVGNMIKRGHPLLEQHFGAQGWDTKVEQMRGERKHWESMGPKQQFYTLVAEERGTFPEEEERAAVEDGFDKTLDNWIRAWEQGDDEEMQCIQLSDNRRFGALSRV